MDLGKENSKEGNSPPVLAAIGEGKKFSYPGLTLNDDAAKEFEKEYECELGHELTATVRLKVTSKRADEFGNSVGFDVLSIDDVEDGPETEEDKAATPTEEESESPEEEAAEEKALGYKRPKVAKETPPLKPADLED